MRCVKKVAQFCLLRVWSFKLNKKNRFRNWHIFHHLHLLVPNSLQLFKLLRLGSGRKFECKLGLSDLPLQRYPTLTSTPIFIILLLKCSLGCGSLLFNHDLSLGFCDSPQTQFMRNNKLNKIYYDLLPVSLCFQGSVVFISLESAFTNYKN